MIFREVEDRDLIAKARRGDVDGYNLLVSRWEKRVFNYLLRLVSNREDALDVSQEVFMKAYQNLPKLDDPARFSGWLFRIAHNEAFSLLRKRRPETELAGEPRLAETNPRLLPIELSLAVESALKRLTEDQREAVLLKIYAHCIDGQATAANQRIADALGTQDADQDPDEEDDGDTEQTS